MLPEGLVWPPRKEDLERLYVTGRLSAAKIADVYGLIERYKTPKVAESTVLYHLKRCGIKRRDPAEHIRKVTDEMVDDWVARYLAGKSLKQIAEDCVSPVTVWNHLRDRGMVPRDKAEAQIQAVTKYERRSFSGDRIERAYLIGLRFGDLDVDKHGRAIRVRLSTTHRPMAALFENVFAPYGHVQRYPRPSPFTGYEWNLECDLNLSFDFLLPQPSIHELQELSKDEFVAFLTGFFDAEGSILLHRKGRWAGFELSITNMNQELLEFISKQLRPLGFASLIRRHRQNDQRGAKGGQNHIWRFEVYRAKDVHQILMKLRPKHPEKIAKANIVLEAPISLGAAATHDVRQKWEELTREIKADSRRFVHEAQEAFRKGHEKGLE